MKHAFRKIVGFLVVVTAAQLYAFHHYNAILAKPVPAVADASPKPSGTDLNKIASAYDALKSQYTCTSLSQNDELAAYVDAQNVLHIEDILTNKTITTVDNNSYPIDYVEWIGNDSVFVGEKEPGGSLLLKRVDANTGSEQVIHTFSGLLSSDDIEKIAYSTETNDTYILIGNPNATVVYHFDTNGNLTTVDLSGRLIKNVAVSQTDDTLYFEDYAQGSFNVGELPLGGQINIMGRDLALIGVAGNSVYTGTLDSNGLVTAVYKDQTTLVKTLSTPMKASDILLTQDGHLLT